MAGAFRAAEKLRADLSGARRPCAGVEVSVTAILGVSVHEGEGSLEECIGRADRAMYRGKRQGRDQVVCNR